MRKKFKRIVPFVLVGVLVSSFVMTNYNKAREVKAVVGVDDLAIAGLVTTLLLAYGYATTQYYNNTDGANALADEWEEEYNQARLTVINGGGGSDNGDDDDKNKFEDTDGDGKITEKDIPPFSNFLTKNAFTLSANASLLLTPIVTKFITEQFGVNTIDNSNLTELVENSSNISKCIADNNLDVSMYPYTYSYFNVSRRSDGYKYEYVKYFLKNGYQFNDDKGFGIVNQSDDYLIFMSASGDSKYGINNGTRYYKLNESTHTAWEFTSTYVLKGSASHYFCNLPSKEAYNNGRIDWVTPELQDTFDNKGNLELLPSFDTLASYSMASQQALQELLSNLASSSLAPAQQLDLVNKFIAGLKTSETPDPSPNPDPSPEPNPNPDPSNPDNGDGDNSGDSDVDKGSFVRDLRTLFPFCIPFDLIDCIRLFNAEPQTPKIDFPIHFPIVNVDYTFTIDLKDFDGVAKICRSMFLIMFIIGLVFATRPLIRG